MADKKPTLIEQQIGEDITEIVQREVERLKDKSRFDGKDALILEKLAKIHALMMASRREDRKANIFGDFSESELAQLADESD